MGDYKVVKVCGEPYLNTDNGYWQVDVRLTGFGFTSNETIVNELYEDAKKIVVGLEV